MLYVIAVSSVDSSSEIVNKDIEDESPPPETDIKP